MLRIKEIRTKKAMTLDQLAEKSGVSKRMISAYEAEENDITLKKLQNIATALGLRITDLIEDNPVSPTNTNSSCTNPECIKKIDRLEKMIDDLIDDKRRLKEEVEDLRKGGSPPGKRVEGDMEKSSKREAS